MFDKNRSSRLNIVRDDIITIKFFYLFSNILMISLPIGVNPKELRDTKTGVFVGACFSESEKTWFYEKMQVNGFGITG